MNSKNLIYCFFLSLVAFGQTKKVNINNHSFSFEKKKLETYDEGKEVVNLFRNSTKLLTHITYKNEGDCSSNSLQLGKYLIQGNKIVFYSYWAICDRMPNLMLPYGFRKQVYQVGENGVVRLKEAFVYIEDFVDGNPKFLEENKFKHKGLNYLDKKPKTTFEKQVLNDYIARINIKHNAKFVLGIQRKQLEQEVRKHLKDEIKLHVGDWIEGEVYGKVRK